MTPRIQQVLKSYYLATVSRYDIVISVISIIAPTANVNVLLSVVFVFTSKLKSLVQGRSNSRAIHSSLLSPLERNVRYQNRARVSILLELYLRLDLAVFGGDPAVDAEYNCLEKLVLQS